MRYRPLTKMSANIGPNMTPMVDVVMCILIFFMLGSSLTPELFLQSNTAIDKTGLGNEQTDQKLPSVRVNIVMQRVGDSTLVSAFGAQPIKMNKVNDPDQSDNQQLSGYFQAKKKSLSDDVQVIIVPEKRVPYQDVITVYDYCTKAQFKQVAFAPAH